MKKLLIILLVVILCTGLVGCRRAQENAVENMLENMIEAQSGGDVDIDIDGDSGDVTFSGEDGDVSFQSDSDGMAWPNDKLPNNVPEVKGVKVVYIMDADTGIYITFEDCNAQIAEDYIKKVEQNGWNITTTYESEGFHMIMATNSDDEMLQFSWEEDGNTGEITYGQQQ